MSETFDEFGGDIGFFEHLVEPCCQWVVADSHMALCFRIQQFVLGSSTSNGFRTIHASQLGIYECPVELYVRGFESRKEEDDSLCTHTDNQHQGTTGPVVNLEQGTDDNDGSAPSIKFRHEVFITFTANYVV